MDFSEEGRKKWDASYPDLEFPAVGRNAGPSSEVIRVPKQTMRVFWGDETEDTVDIIIAKRKEP